MLAWRLGTMNLSDRDRSLGRSHLECRMPQSGPPGRRALRVCCYPEKTRNAGSGDPAYNIVGRVPPRGARGWFSFEAISMKWMG
jgi:hypothetical protein